MRVFNTEKGKFLQPFQSDMRAACRQCAAPICSAGWPVFAVITRAQDSIGDDYV
jgi:Fe-S-cluster-containing dehydrogenase component